MGVRVLWVGVSLLLVVGCAAADVKLKNPQTGQTAVCKGGYYEGGALGVLYEGEKEAQRLCLRDYERRGYVRVP